MKQLILLISLFFTGMLPAQHLEVGDLVPPFSLPVLGEDESVLHSSDLAGKAILLDFWATWCSPCIGGMPHLDSLQTIYGNDLQVIAVSEEKHERLLRFVQNTQHRFRFGRDTGALRELFHYQVIPHAVLISPEGRVVAITAPANITVAAIRKVLAGEPIDLPRKEDRQEFDPEYDYFQADTLTQYAFQIQPYKSKLPSFTKAYWSGPFSQRRYTAYNMTIDGLYRHAFSTTSYRLEYTFDEALVDWENVKNRYCMDIVVQKPADLLPALRQELAAAFPIKARLEMREKEVVVIRTLDGEVTAPAGAPTEQYAGRGDGFSSTGATIGIFCNYLEGFGIFGYPVVDETAHSGSFEFDFAFDPENSASFRAEMERYGLTYAKEIRKIEVLVLYLEE